jgi:hypothetical protein
MASVKQFLVDVMLFAVGGGEGILSPCEQQQQHEKCFKWGKGNKYISVLNKFSVMGCEKKHGGGNKKKLKIKFKLVCVVGVKYCT